jgi:hypothetical protein
MYGARGTCERVGTSHSTELLDDSPGVGPLRSTTNVGGQAENSRGIGVWQHADGTRVVGRVDLKLRGVGWGGVGWGGL